MTDGKLVCERAGDAGIDDALRLIGQDHRLRAKGGEDLADAAHGGDDLAATDRAAHELDAADGFGNGIDNVGTQGLHLHVHRCNNADHMITPHR